MTETMPFAITWDDFSWIDGGKDDPADLCSHGRVTVRAGTEVLSYDCCTSAAALRMLRTLTEDHRMEEPYRGEQMLPCCGFELYPAEDGETVTILGCGNGVDYAVRHRGDLVLLTTGAGKELTVSIEDYRREVLAFARQVEAFYKNSSPKLPSKDDLDGYLAFWKEWRRRMEDQ